MFTILLEQYKNTDVSSDKLLGITEKMLVQSEKDNDPVEIFYANLYRGQALFYAGQYSGSLNHCDVALSYSKMFPLGPEVILLHLIMGDCYCKCENASLAISSYLIGIDIAKDIGSTDYLNFIYLNLAYLQILSKDYSDALATLYSASKLVPNDKDEALLYSFNLQAYLSYCFFFLEKFDSLEKSYNDANNAYFRKKQNTKRDSVHYYTIRTIHYMIKRAGIEVGESCKLLANALKEDGSFDYDAFFMMIPAFLENGYMDEVKEMLAICEVNMLDSSSSKADIAFYSCMFLVHMEMENEEECNKYARLYFDSSRVMNDEQNMLVSDFIRQQHNLSKLKEKIDSACKEILIDATSGTYNKKALDTIIKPKFYFAKMNGKQMGVCCVSAKAIKEYNERYGFAEGDACIGKIGKEINKITSLNTYVIRYTDVLYVVFFFNQSKDSMFSIIQDMTKRVKMLGIRNDTVPEGIVTIETAYYYFYAFPVDTMERFIERGNARKPFR